MSERTGIGWTDHTWSPWWGCTQISLACDHCYARELDSRYGGAHWGPDAPRKRMSEAHWKAPLIWNRKVPASETRLVFPSMCDPFDNHAMAAALRPRFFDLMRATPNLTWLLLSKRIGNAADMAQECGGWPANAWAGATVVTQREADRDIPKLLELDGPQVRFVSIEPMLESIDIGGETSAWRDYLRERETDNNGPIHRALDWVIVGGESGNNARPLRPEWARSIRDQCDAANVPFFFKQWGGSRPTSAGKSLDGREHCDRPHQDGGKS